MSEATGSIGTDVIRIDGQLMRAIEKPFGGQLDYLLGMKKYADGLSVSIATDPDKDVRVFTNKKEALKFVGRSKLIDEKIAVLQILGENSWCKITIDGVIYIIRC